jgi:5-oxoprolinase (ATP-hydrolysing)
LNRFQFHLGTCTGYIDNIVLALTVLSLMSMVKIVPRGHTAVVDAYLTPLIKQYIKGFSSGFDDNFSKVDVSFMMSDGGLCPVDLFNGYRSILSGPAGGVVGYAMTTYDKNTKQPVIGIDMVRCN